MSHLGNSVFNTIQDILGRNKSFNSIVSSIDKWNSMSKAIPLIDAWEKLNQNNMMGNFIRHHNAMMTSLKRNEAFMSFGPNSALAKAFFTQERLSSFNKVMNVSPIIDIQQSPIFNQFINYSGLASTFGKTFLDRSSTSLLNNFKQYNHVSKLNLDSQISAVFDSIRHYYLNNEDEIAMDYIENEFKSFINTNWTGNSKDNSLPILLNQLFTNCPGSKLSWDQWIAILSLLLSLLSYLSPTIPPHSNNITVNNNTTIINNICDISPK